jgi:hypothetical protein
MGQEPFETRQFRGQKRATQGRDLIGLPAIPLPNTSRIVPNPPLPAHAPKHPIEVRRIQENTRFRTLFHSLDDPVPVKRALSKHRKNQKVARSEW